MEGRSVERRLQALAIPQHGVVSVNQLIAAGISPRCVRTLRGRGRLEQIHPRVYRVDGADMTRRLRCMAATLWGGPDAVICGKSAAESLGLLDAASGPIEVSSPQTRARRPGIVLYRRILSAGERTTIDNIPVTAPGRTLLDLCNRHPRVAEASLDAALRIGLIDIDELRGVVERASASRLGGVARLRSLTEVRGDGDALSESELESTVLRLLRSASYPLPQQQVPMDIGGRLVRVDFYYPEAKLVIEVDGHRWHAGRRRQIQDQRRDHSLLLHGLGVLRFTWEDITRRPGYFLEIVGEALGIVSSSRAPHERR